MQPGYYWAKCGPVYQPKQYGNTWRIVQVVAGLHTAVLEGGYAVKQREYSEFVGPLEPPPAGGCKPAWIMPPVVRPEFHIHEDD